MTYNANNVKQIKEQYIEWAKNLASDIEKKQEEPKEHNIFPNSQEGDIATIKDLIGNFLAVLTDSTVTIK